MKQVKVFLMGIGGYGANYLKELMEETIVSVVIEGICEVNPEAVIQFPVIEEKKIPIFSSPEEFCQNHEADLAVIATPIHLHYQQILTCLAHGSHVLTEKPVCTSVMGAKMLKQAEGKAGRFVAVGYQLNYSRDVLALERQNRLADAYQNAQVLESCVGCGRCVDVCWHEGIAINGNKAQKTDRCIGCGYCFQVCPVNALHVEKERILASVFEERGIGRGRREAIS